MSKTLRLGVAGLGNVGVGLVHFVNNRVRALNRCCTVLTDNLVEDLVGGERFATRSQASIDFVIRSCSGSGNDRADHDLTVHGLRGVITR